MRADFRPLDVPDAPGNGREFRSGEYADKTVQVCEAFAGSLDIEVSLNGIDFDKVETAVTAPGLFVIPHTCSHLRIVTTAMTGPPPAVMFGGLATRS